MPLMLSEFLTGEEQLYDKRELAKKLKTSIRTLERLHEQRIGPPQTTVGDRVYYRKSSVAMWLLNRETKPPARGKGRAR
jgi:hypothetical protein